MCGYDGRLGTEAVGLDAAHLRWWAFDGPDLVENGLCLCSFHHKLMDRGVLGLVLRLVGESLILPQRGQAPPAIDHITWHADQVFRAPARVPA